MANHWAVDLFEQDGDLIVEVALPGVRLEDVSLMGHSCRLLISARRPHEQGVRRYHQRGARIPREFAHDVELPAQARLELARASFVQGLLRVCIPLGPDDTKLDRAIPVDDEVLRWVRRGPDGAAAVQGGSAAVPVPGLAPGAAASAPRCCALCGAWMDAAGEKTAPPPRATRFGYGLCDGCR